MARLPTRVAKYADGAGKVLLLSVLTRPVALSVNVPRGAMPVMPALTTVPASSARPAGLKNTLDPSSHGAATPAPARPIMHELCS